MGDTSSLHFDGLWVSAFDYRPPHRETSLVRAESFANPFKAFLVSTFLCLMCTWKHICSIYTRTRQRTMLLSRSSPSTFMGLLGFKPKVSDLHKHFAKWTISQTLKLYNLAHNFGSGLFGPNWPGCGVVKPHPDRKAWQRKPLNSQSLGNKQKEPA